jgi:1-acyl-sn-glycerol-3-phosphate acyltransferase
MSRPPWPAGNRFLRTLVILGVPLRWWCRLQVSGAEELRAPGPVLLVSNHDSSLDPLVLVDTGMRNGRTVRFLARDSLWHSRLLGLLLDGIGQIPVRRGDHDVRAIGSAVHPLRAGDVVGVFPEGRLSRGESLRAHTGVARLSKAVPEARVVLAAVSGGTELVRFPRRPNVIVELFAPQGGQPSPDENPAELARRLLDETRRRVPPAVAGRAAGRQSASSRWHGLCSLPQRVRHRLGDKRVATPLPSEVEGDAQQQDHDERDCGGRLVHERRECERHQDDDGG